MNTITLEMNGDPRATFAAPADPYVAREIWLLLVDNLRPGLTVRLLEGGRELVEESGVKLTPAQYAEVMGAPTLPGAGDQLADVPAGGDQVADALQLLAAELRGGEARPDAVLLTGVGAALDHGAEITIRMVPDRLLDRQYPDVRVSAGGRETSLDLDPPAVVDVGSAARRLLRPGP